MCVIIAYTRIHVFFETSIHFENYQQCNCLPSISHFFGEFLRVNSHLGYCTLSFCSTNLEKHCTIADPDFIRSASKYFLSSFNMLK